MIKRSGETKEIVDIFYEKKEFVHCNFGWGGQDNGYYLSKVFDTIRGPEMRAGGGRGVILGTHGEKYVYRFNHHIIKGIHKK